MAVPTKPTAPDQPLRSDPSTFSARAESAISYQFGALPDWIETVGTFCEDQANIAEAAAIAAGAAGGLDLTDKAGFSLAVNPGETAVELTDLSTLFMPRDGSVAMTSALPMGDNKITGLAEGTADGDATRVDQVQPVNPVLTGISGLSSVPSGRILYTTGTNQFSNATISSVGRDFISRADTASQLSALGIQTKVSTQSNAAWEGGSSTTESVVSPAKIRRAIEEYVDETQKTSGSYGIVSGTTATFAHNFGALPAVVQVWLRCFEAEHGYTPGNRVAVSSHTFDDRLSTLIKTTEEVLFGFTTVSSAFVISHRTTRAIVGITNSKWRLIFQVIK